MTSEFCPECYTELEITEYPGRVCGDCGWFGNSERTHSDYTVIEVELNKIWSDDDFNCRGHIIPFDVVDLIKDIEKNGLQFPITVQPLRDVNVDFNSDTTYKFRIVAGHRRFKSFQVLKRDTIPVMVKIGLSEIQSRLLNLGENLKREALNILQEAVALKRLRDFGLNRRQVSEELDQSPSWVQVRFNLLDLPEDIQAEAAAGMLNQRQIKELFSLTGKDAQYEAVRKIKKARIKGEKGVSVAKSPEQDPFKKKRQSKNVVQEMIKSMGDTIGYGLHTRTLAWANGEISSVELFSDIKQYADDNGLEYTMPLEC